jgi:hypothetical protein
MNAKKLLPALLVLAAGSASAGEFYTYSSGNLWMSAPSFQNANVTGYSNGAGSGQFLGNFTSAASATADSLVRFFCVEISQYAVIPGPTTYSLTSSSSAWANTTIYDNLRKLYDVAYLNPGLGDFWNGSAQTAFGAFTPAAPALAAAFQLAVWEIVFDTGLNLSSGAFKDNGGSTGAAQAQTWLNQVSSYSGTGYQSWNLYRFTNPTQQDFVAATHTVPEPGALALAALALCGVGYSARRRPRAAHLES